MASRKRNTSASKSYAGKKKLATSETMGLKDCERQQPLSAPPAPSISAKKLAQQLLKLKELWTAQVAANRPHGLKGEASKEEEPIRYTITQHFEMLNAEEPFSTEWLRLLHLVFRDFNEGSKMESLMKHFDDSNVAPVDNHDAIVAYVFEKAVSDPKNGQAHASFCKELVEVERHHIQTVGAMNTFKCKLALKCQKEFMKCKKEVMKLGEIEEQIRAAQHEGRTAEKCKLVFLPYEMQQRATATALFMGELYNVGILTSSVIKCCLGLLLNEPSEAKVERACKLISMTGQKMEQGDEKALNDCFATLSQLLHPSKQVVTSSPLKTEIQRLRKLRMNGWRRLEVNTRSHRITREDLVGLYRKKLREENSNRMNLVPFIKESIENLSLARHDNIEALKKVTKTVVLFLWKDPRVRESFAECLADLIAASIISFPDVVLICFAETNGNDKFTDEMLRLLFVALYKRHGRVLLTKIIKMKNVAATLRDKNYARLLSISFKKFRQMKIENLDNEVD